MANNQAELSKKLQAQGAKMTPLAFENDLNRWWADNGKMISRLAGSPDEAKRIYATAFVTVSKTPKLAECTIESFAACLCQSAALKLYPGPMQECAYVPLWNRKDKKNEILEANFWPQYQGLVKLAYNSGFIRKIQSAVVWESDQFEYARGSREQIFHVPFDGPEKERGPRVGTYCIVENRYGGEHIAFLSVAFITRMRASSRGASMPDSPWNSDNPDRVDWMWKKSSVKQALKLLPKSSELAQAIQADDAFESPEIGKAEVLDLGGNKSPPSPRIVETTKAIDADRRESIEIPTKRTEEEVLRDADEEEAREEEERRNNEGK